MGSLTQLKECLVLKIFKPIVIIILTLFSCSSILKDMQHKSVNTKNSIFSVKDFGALGNGVKDDSKAIQNCFDYIESIGGGTAFFPEGEYIVSRTKQRGKTWSLRATNNLKIKGVGTDKSIIKLASKQLNYTRMLYVEKVNNVVVENITFNGNKDYQVNPKNPNEHLGGVFIDQGSNVRITNSNFINTGGDGIGLRGIKTPSKNVVIDSCYFNGNQRNGITLGSGFSDVIIRNNFFDTAIDDSPIDTEPHSGICKNVLIENNKILTPTILTIGGPSPTNKGENFIVKNNVLKNCVIMMVNTGSSTISNNYIHNNINKKQAITILGANNNITIKDNEIETLNKDAFYIIKTTYNRVGPENINVINNKINLKGTKVKAVHCAGANNLLFSKNLITSKLEGGNAGFYFFSNYPMSGINISDNIFENVDYSVMINPLKNNTIEKISISENEFKTSSKKQIIFRKKTQIKEVQLNKNTLNGKEVKQI